MVNIYNMQRALERHNPIWKYPPERWEQGLLLGNGTMGAVIWGNGLPLKLTVDNTNFWDRTGWKPSNPEKFKWANFKRLIEEGKVKEGEKEFQNPGNAPISTRIPPSRMEIWFPEETKFLKMELNLYDAIACGKLINKESNIKFSSFIYSKENLLVMEFEGNIQPTFKFRLFSDPHNTPIDLKSVNRGTYIFKDWIKRYPGPKYIKEGNIEMFSQEVPDGGELAYAFAVIPKDGKTTLYLSTAYDREGKIATKIASNIVKHNFTTSFNEIAKEHRHQWHTYYSASFISVPDTRLEGLYWMEIYKLRCCTHSDAPPISLHGPWSPDGKMPPWGGDYHHNINVQMSYWPIYASNHLELGYSLYNFIKKARPVFKKFCKDFFERDGEFVPHATDIDGNPKYDWASGQFEFNGGLWLAHHLWLHWLYSQDKGFLKDYVYPFTKEIVRPLLKELKEYSDGYLHLPWSFSPEYGGLKGSFWGPDTTCDLALLRWALTALLDADNKLRIKDKERETWQKVLEHLAPYPTSNILGLKVLSVRGDLPLQTSHRHHSHLMPIYPLHLLTLDGNEEEKSLIKNSIRQLIFMGHGEWVGFSFSWAASIFACTGYPDLARTMLLDYTDKMITENTFMMQGPQQGCDMSVHGTYALTLEAGFGAANALLDMLIQSYGGIIRLFPGIPEGWQEAVFHNLRAEGAYLVSAIRKKGKCVLARIFSEKGGEVKIQGNFETNKVLLFSSKGKRLAKNNVKDVKVKLKKEEEIFIVPEGYDLPIEVEIREIKGKEYENHFFGIKNKISLFPRL